LNPRQPLTPAPHAIYSGSAASSAAASNQAVNQTANGTTVLRIESVPDPYYGSATANSLGGSSANIISNGFVGTFIGGGGNASYPNRVGADYASVLGGLGNTASGEASTAMGRSATASVFISTEMRWNITANGNVSTAMGRKCTANGDSSTATGRQAKALHDGTFVRADSQVADFASTGNNQFCIRASGGVQLSTDMSVFFGSQTRQMLNLYGTVDADGVALAAIQGLNQKVEQKNAKIAELKRELEKLKQVVDKLANTTN
jgi:hypothetical protein